MTFLVSDIPYSVGSADQYLLTSLSKRSKSKKKFSTRRRRRRATVFEGTRRNQSRITRRRRRGGGGGTSRNFTRTENRDPINSILETLIPERTNSRKRRRFN
jgi:hypothetical protein